MARTPCLLIEEMAARAPEAPALCFEGETVDRGALQRRANRIARWLTAQGVGRGDRVAVCLDKSPDAVAALLAIWKADGVCVPLDANGPAPRLATVLADSDPAALVTSKTKARRLDAVRDEGAALPRRLELGDEEAEAGLSGLADGPLPRRSLDEDLAYILYTSGSTGRPKGVMITHRNVMAFSDWAGSYFDVSEADRVSSHAPFHFDLSLFDLWTTLVHGATVCLVPQGIGFLGVDLARFLADNRITVWQSVPSVLMLMAKHLEPGQPGLETLRLVFFAGEPYPPPALRDLMARVPQARYVNIYGSTEANDVTALEIDTPPGDAPLPIGRPCAHMEAIVVDDEGRLVTGEAAVGELCARGPTVAKGYWRDAEMTAARFVQNPVHALYPDPVYRSGDMVERGADGMLRYLGRRDAQVKIRGNRVNLREVEDALLVHSAIAEAAVIDVPGEAGARQLKACLVLAGGAELSVRDLKRHCLAQLPAYMVPEIVEMFVDIPKTSTGKIDRQSLRRSAEKATGPAN
jgi:amino acid adenylation domain-containing protein